MIEITEEFRRKIRADICPSGGANKESGVLAFHGENYAYEVLPSEQIVARILSTKEEVDRFSLLAEVQQ